MGVGETVGLNGPLTLLNTAGPITGNDYFLYRGSVSSFYRVRAVKLENPDGAAGGLYYNLSAGALA